MAVFFVRSYLNIHKINVNTAATTSTMASIFTLVMALQSYSLFLILKIILHTIRKKSTVNIIRNITLTFKKNQNQRES